jgi:hypothetical protein
MLDKPENIVSEKRASLIYFLLHFMTQASSLKIEI